MRTIILYILLILSCQLLTQVSFAISSAENECKEDSVRLQDEISAYHNVTLCLSNSLRQRILMNDTVNELKNMYVEKNKSELGTDELNKALSKKVETLERNIDDIMIRLSSLKLSTGNVTCPKGNTHYKPDKFCFKFYTDCKQWLEARRACPKDGGDLISLKENKCVKAHVWVGTTYIFLEEGEWYWLNGERVSYTFWISGQP